MARAYWPGEYHDEANSGHGLTWVLLLLATAVLAILGQLVAGRVRLRWSWTDAAVYALFALVALSARQGAEARVAINLAWEWVGVGLAYALVRHLPRTASEVSALAGSMMATAVALAAFGLYQVAVVHPETRRMYLENPEQALRIAGVADDPSTRKQFEDRVLGSKEPTSTFALANSLAGVLVGPAVLGLAVALTGLGNRREQGSRIVALLLASLPWLLLLACLLLTKSRSAYLGMAAGAAVLAWRGRRLVPPRLLLGTGLGLAGLLVAMAAIGAATRQLDVQVLTESTKSLRYRGEYWIGALRVIGDGSWTWWTGYGPGNFGGPYLRHKLPQASEGISDPHNLFLEVWATAGLPALLALIAALGFGLRDLLGSATPSETAETKRLEDQARVEDEDADLARPPAGTAWLVLSAGAGWLLAMLLRPDLGPFAQSLNPFENDLMRWIVLGGTWVWAVLTGMPLWSKGPVPVVGLGAGVVALVVNLLAAGGIGFAPVALVLWGFLAMGQDLRGDRPCGRLRNVGGWAVSFGIAAAWAALAGTFAGTVGPYWKAERALEEAVAEQQRARSVWAGVYRTLPTDLPENERAETAFAQAEPLFNRAVDAYRRAAEADRLASRPWIGRALLEYEAWRDRGSPVGVLDLVWHRIDSALRQAMTPPRNPNALGVQTLRAEIATELPKLEGWPAARRDGSSRTGSKRPAPPST